MDDETTFEEASQSGIAGALAIVPEMPAVAILRGERSEWRVLGHVVGKGGAGKVFPAFSTRLKKEAAVKVMHLSGAGGECFTKEGLRFPAAAVTLTTPACWSRCCARFRPPRTAGL
eukprot:RCo052257